MGERIAKIFPGSIHAWNHDCDTGSNISGSFPENNKKNDRSRRSRNCGNDAVAMGSPVTGPFRGDPFFDPWAKGGAFSK